MYRITSLARSPVATASASSISLISRRAAGAAATANATTNSLRGANYATGTGTDATTASGQPLDPAQAKNHKDAKSYHGKSAPLSEGVSHSVDRADQSKPFRDSHTEEVSKAQTERKSGGASSSDFDAVKLSSQGSSETQKQRQPNSTPSSDYQPGQKGEQVGSNAASGEPLKAGEGMGEQKTAASGSTFAGLGQAAKNMFGSGPASGQGFHTFSRLNNSGTRGTPSEAVDKGARKPKDSGVGGEQSPHLRHHAEGEGDQMPAVKNDAGLPSKGGKKPDDKGQKRTFSTTARGLKAGNGTNTGKGPAAEKRATGTADTPGSRAVDPKSQTHSPSWAPDTEAQAVYKHVTGSPEPDSRQSKYSYSTSTASGAIPSGTAPRSSTSPDAPHPKTTAGILKNEAGIGSSNVAGKESVDHTSAEEEHQIGQEPGQAGDNVGGRAYAPPPDVGEIEEDTLPKPIKP